MPQTEAADDLAPPGRNAQGSADRWGPLWGFRAADWAANEEQQRPTYEEAIRRVGIEPGARVLDVGCGAGVFLALAAERGARPSGLDASEALIELAAERVPAAELRVGEMQALPWEDDVFDLVTGFNSFFFAADMVAALREAGRVARAGAPVVIQVWGPPERNELEAVKRVMRGFAPAPPPDAPAPPPLYRREVLEGIAVEAGLEPELAFSTSWAFEWPDAETLGRELIAPMGLAKLVGPEREPEVRAALAAALAPQRTGAGGYRVRNEFRYLVARAPAGAPTRDRGPASRS